MHAADQADVRPGDAVAVFGCGPIGLSAIATLVDRGHERVVAVDLSETRRELALGLGAQAAIDPAATDVWGELTELHGAKPFMFGPTAATDAFIEATGSASVLTNIIDHAGVQARLSVVAVHYAPIPTSFLMVLMKELTLRGSIEYPARFRNAIDLLERRDLSGLITHRFALEQFDDALAVLSGSKDCGKVLVTIDDSQW
jgi:threonine dehydrogenase-like Zn-dependent dehydrogenase